MRPPTIEVSVADGRRVKLERELLPGLRSVAMQDEMSEQ